MVWYGGMVWYGVVSCDVMWCGLVWYMIWYSTIRHSIDCYLPRQFKMNQDDTLDDSGSQMIVSIESHDILELTITKTNLDVFSELGKVCISRIMFQYLTATRVKPTTYVLKYSIYFISRLVKLLQKALVAPH